MYTTAPRLEEVSRVRLTSREREKERQNEHAKGDHTTPLGLGLFTGGMESAQYQSILGHLAMYILSEYVFYVRTYIHMANCFKHDIKHRVFQSLLVFFRVVTGLNIHQKWIKRILFNKKKRQKKKKKVPLDTDCWRSLDYEDTQSTYNTTSHQYQPVMTCLKCLNSQCMI